MLTATVSPSSGTGINKYQVYLPDHLLTIYKYDIFHHNKIASIIERPEWGISGKEMWNEYFYF